MLERLHRRIVFERRVDVIVGALERLLPVGARVLDVGCGNGWVSRRLMDRRDDLAISGLDVLRRKESYIPVRLFNGETLPFADDAFDCVLFIDVLHHTKVAARLIAEAARVASQTLIIKDHLLDPVLAYPTLAFMDWVGNSHQGVVLPNNYWRRASWDKTFSELGISVLHWEPVPRLYPWPFSHVFGRGLHFVASLQCAPSRTLATPL